MFKLIVILAFIGVAFGINPKISFISGPEIVKDIGISAFFHIIIKYIFSNFLSIYILIY